MGIWPRAVTLVNGHVVSPAGVASSIRFGSRVLEVGGPPRRGDTVIDLDGAFVLPGLINAHDHLELNHYGRIKLRERYASASEWIDDMRPRLEDDPAIRANRGHALESRLLMGAIKNVVAGVTTVAHHNPLYREIRRGFPVRVVRRYGWAHSFALERGPAGAHGEPGGVVAERYRRTPRGHPFFVHIAEGIDRGAAEEVQRLDAAGALHANTVLVHGVAIPDASWTRVHERRASLVWCPASNHFLFGHTPPVGSWLAGGRGDRISLGTDSRLTGSRDLLDEMRCASRHSRVEPEDVLRMATTAAAAAIRMPDLGRLAAGSPADLIVVPRLDDVAARALLAASRADLALVTIDGRPRIGDARMAAVFAARRVPPRSITVDDREKLADAALVGALTRATVREPGVAW